MGDLSPLSYRLAAVLLLLLMAALALGSMTQKAPTFDEQGFIVRGLAYQRGYPHIRVGHPLGLNAFNASLLIADQQVILPVDDTSWNGTGFHRPAELFLWEIGNNVEHIMFLARLPSIWLGLLLAALTARWAGQLTALRWVALAALLFVALDPNILAHTRLATTDLGLSAFALLAAYMLWRFLRAPSLRLVLVAGAAMGLLQNTKFTALLFVPLFGLVCAGWLIGRWRDQKQKTKESYWAAVPWRELLLIGVVYPLTAVFTLWATNGFEIATMPADLPLLPALSGLTLPLANYLEQLLDIGGRLSVVTPTFLLGDYSDSGWWYYFPVAFLVKTPLATLILLAWGSVACIVTKWRRKQAFPSLLDSSVLLVPALGFFAIALTTDINLGYRHILPIVAPLIVFAVSAVAGSVRPPSGLRISILLGLGLWLLVASLVIYPNYLSFFNLIAGGPDNGWRALVDSNLDWGQDLDDLAPWMAANNVDEVWLSYFGEARPEYYGVNYRGLDSFPPRLMNPQARPYYPSDPAPGIYAISATNLQGVHFADHEQFAWFRDKEPLDKLGHSIFLYEVPPSGEAVDLVLAGMQLDQVPQQGFAQLGSNDVRPRWVDQRQAMIFPAAEEYWLARPSGAPINPSLQAVLAGNLQNVSHDGAFEIGRYDMPAFQSSGSILYTLHSGQVQLLGADLQTQRDNEIVLLTTWRQQGSPQPLAIFVHALNSEDRIVAQWDGLGASWEGWREGDTLLQVHELSAADGSLADAERLAVGLYDPQSGERWRTNDGSEYLDVPLR